MVASAYLWEATVWSPRKYTNHYQFKHQKVTDMLVKCTFLTIAFFPFFFFNLPVFWCRPPNDLPVFLCVLSIVNSLRAVAINFVSFEISTVPSTIKLY